MDIQVRDEAQDDVEAIRQVTELAFENAPHTEHTEQFIVEALRRHEALTLSLVAELNGKIIGHVAVSPVSISDGTVNWFGLGPISVLPAYQAQGIGSKLMKRALSILEDRKASGCVVLGAPSYYGRFGFKTVEGLTLPDVPAKYFQALCFHGSLPQGKVTYHEAFSARD